MFSARNDMEKLKAILDWDGVRKASFSVEGASEWTDEELKNKAELTDDEIAKFHENLLNCTKTAKERNADDTVIKLIEASERVCFYRDSMYYLDKSGVFISGFKARDKLAYNITRSIKGASDIVAFMQLDDASQAVEVTSLYTRYIRVGDRFFDSKTGEMVDEAPTEFRTYKINRNVDYKPVSLDKCKSKLVTDLLWSIGKEEFRYILLSMAYSLTNLRNDKRAIILIGESRSGKTTICNVFQRIGLMPNEDFTDDLSGKGTFLDRIGEGISLYPAVSGSDCESVDWIHVKKMSSDPMTQVNRKGEVAITVPNRGFILLSTNRAPKTGLIGVVNKIAILKTHNSFKNSVDSDYLETIEQTEGFDEFISLILTMCHKLTIPASEMPDGRQWTPSSIVEVDNEMRTTHLEWCRNSVPTDMFYTDWDRTSEEKVPLHEAYRAYLMYCNPDAEWKAINDALEDSIKAPSKAPNGLNGNSRTNFISDAKASGIKYTKSGNDKCLIGHPPVEGYHVESAEFKPEKEWTMGTDVY